MPMPFDEVQRQAHAEIERLRDLLERPSDEAKTDYLRGQIAGLRWLLALPQRNSKDEKLVIGDPGNLYRS